MKDPKTKDTLTNRNEIKQASLNYCVELLTNRSPKEGYEEETRMKDLIHSLRMEENLENDVEFTKKTFENSLKEVKKKNEKKYEFVVRSGKSFKEASFNLFSLLWNTEVKLEQ